MPVEDIEPADLAAMMDRGEVVLVDVREESEYAAARIPGTVLLPMSRFDPAALPATDRRIVLQCRSGARSAHAGMILEQAGRGPAAHLKGGILAWAAAGLPVEGD